MIIPNIGKWCKMRVGPFLLLRRYWIVPGRKPKLTRWAKVVVDLQIDWSDGF